MSHTKHPNGRRILIIDDNPSIHQDFRKILCPHMGNIVAIDQAEVSLFGGMPASPKVPGFEVESAYQGQEGVAAVQQAVQSGDPFAIAFVDVRMPPGWDGLETTERIWQADPDLQVILCTAYSDYSWAEMVKRLGVTDNLMILKKPFDPVAVMQLAHALTKKWVLFRSSRRLLEDSEALYRSLVENLPQNIFRKDLAGQFTFANNRFCELLNKPLEEVLGKTDLDLYPPELARKYRNDDAYVIEHGEVLELIEENQLPNGNRRYVQVVKSPVHDSMDQTIGVQCVFWDITERKQLEEQLRQSQKMEAIGQLAGGVAHDFNNLLTIITGYIRLILDENDLTPTVTDQLGQITGAANRAADLTRRLLTYSRKQPTNRQPLNLTELLVNISKMLSRVLGEDVALQLECPEPNLVIHADPGMMDQVVLNLASNARDAMPGGGRLMIRATSVQLIEKDLRGKPEARPGHFVCLTVKDSGCGIAAEDLRHIFEPFFTTKDLGKGTGLGLATVYGIVQLHQGWIDVESQPGQGTVFQIFFPARESFTQHPSTPVRQQSVLRGTETILFVEDEPALGELGRAVLQRHGYRVLEADSGVGALKIWKERGSDVDLVVTDMIMPGGISGHDLAAALRAERPSLQVLYMSGYSAEMPGVGGEEEASVNFLSKPFTPQALLAAIRRCLDRKASSCGPVLALPLCPEVLTIETAGLMNRHDSMPVECPESA
jgi:two-component system cell cycle sensor histidine kinase/response regulator CckA